MTAYAWDAGVSGVWSLNTNWDPVGVPGNGDTVSIPDLLGGDPWNGTVTVDENTTIGTSPGDTTTDAVTVGRRNVLKVAANVTLTCNGRMNVTGASNEGGRLQLEAGATLAMASNYQIYGRGAASGWEALLVVNGTSGSRCTISTASGGLVDMRVIEAEYLDFTGAWTHLSFDASTSTTGKLLSVKALAFLRGTWYGKLAQVENCTLDNSAGASDHKFKLIAGATWTNNVTTCPATNTIYVDGTATVDISDSVFHGTVSDNSVSDSCNWSNNFHVITAGTNVLSVKGDVQDSYFLATDAIALNWHPLGSGTDYRHVEISGNVFDGETNAGSADAERGDYIQPSSGNLAFVGTVKNNIQLMTPDGHSGGAFVSYLSGSPSYVAEITHNTFPTTRQTAGGNSQTGICYGENVGTRDDMITVCKSNLVYDNDKNEGFLLYNLSTIEKDGVTAAGVDYNGGTISRATGNNGRGCQASVQSFVAEADDDTFTDADHPFDDDDIVWVNTNGTLPEGLSVETDYYIINSDATTYQLSLSEGGGAINITTDGASSYAIPLMWAAGNAAAAGVDDNWVAVADPLFVDDTRRFETWAQSLGAADTAEGIVEIKKLNDADYDSNYSISDLVDWVQAGYAPQAPALEDAGHDSVTIGAMEMAAGGTILPHMMQLSS